MSVDEYTARTWFDELEDRPSNRGFSGAGFSHKSERFPPFERKADPLNGMDIGDVAAEGPLAHRKACNEIFDTQHFAV